VAASEVRGLSQGAFDIFQGGYRTVHLQEDFSQGQEYERIVRSKPLSPKQLRFRRFRSLPVMVVSGQQLKVEIKGD
jgi:hypothetical protein